MNNRLFTAFALILTVGISYLWYTSPLSPETIYARNKQSSCVILSTIVYKLDKKEHTLTCSGSGLFRGKEGYVQTALHCVSLPADKRTTAVITTSVIQVIVTQPDNSKRAYEARLAGVDESVDVAILKVLDIKSDDCPGVKLADSSSVLPGQTVYSIASPFAQEFFGSISSATIGFVNRPIADTKIKYRIQLDRASYVGSSGGPVFNTRGEVIGMIQADVNDKPPALSLLVPNNLVLFERLKKGDVTIPSVGLDILQDDFTRYSSTNDFHEEDLVGLRERLPGIADDKLRRIAMSSICHAAIITCVTNKQLQSRVDIGDIILKIDDTEIKNGQDFGVYLHQKVAGEMVVLTILKTSTSQLMVESVFLK